MQDEIISEQENLLPQGTEQGSEQDSKQGGEKAKQEFVKAQSECYLCGEQLNTCIEYLPESYFVVERAQCHSCMTVVRVQNHSLQ